MAETEYQLKAIRGFLRSSTLGGWHWQRSLYRCSPRDRFVNRTGEPQR